MTRMDSEQLRALESAEEWDFEHASKRPGVKGRRAVVSVAFPRDEFEVVDEGAERSGEKLSEFIRKAALNRASRHSAIAATALSGGDGFIVGSHWMAGVTQAAVGVAEVVHNSEPANIVFQPA